MSDPLAVPSGERGVLRLFALDDQLGMDIGHTGAIDRLYRALGVEALNDKDVQIVQLQVIADMGLATFLNDAYGIDPAQIAAHSTALDALDGDIALIRSGAFDGQAARLKSDGEAVLIASFTETPTDWTARPMQTASARRRIAPRAIRSRARRIGAALFGAMIFLILATVILIAT